MATGSLVPSGKLQFTTALGTPLVGGSVYFYIPGTTTFKNTYQDPALTILNTNPVILDARGEAIVWGSGDYQQVVRDVFGNLIWSAVSSVADTSNVQTQILALLASSDINAGDALITVKQPFTQSVALTQHLKNQDFISVKDFGATGNGITVEDGFFSAAAKNAPSSNIAGVTKGNGVPRPPSSIVFVPDGTYLINTYLDVGNKDITWILSYGAKIINPQYLNGRVTREGRQSNMNAIGNSGYATGSSVRVMPFGYDLTDGPEVLGITSPSQLTQYGDRDIVAAFGDVTAPPVITTLTGTTYSSTTITHGTTFNTKLLRVGMIIDVPSSGYGGVVSSWTADFTTITVTGWYQFGGAAGVPADGASAVINAFTKIWGLNFNVALNALSYANKCTAMELGIQNNKAYNSFTTGADVVNIGAAKVGTLFRARGGTATADFGLTVENTTTGIQLTDISTAYLLGITNADTEIQLGHNNITMGPGARAANQTINFRTSGLRSGGVDAQITVTGGDATTLATIGISSIAVLTHHHYPTTDATYDLGYAGNGRWRNQYLVNAAIVSSDENLKTEIQAIPDDVLDAWETVNFSMYKMKSAVAEKGDAAARFHFGVIAQGIQTAFVAKGLDPFAYGVLCYDTYDAKAAVYSSAIAQVKDPATGKILQPAVPAQLISPATPAGSCYSVRYEEALTLEAALMRRTIARLQAKLGA